MCLRASVSSAANSSALPASAGEMHSLAEIGQRRARRLVGLARRWRAILIAIVLEQPLDARQLRRVSDGKARLFVEGHRPVGRLPCVSMRREGQREDIVRGAIGLWSPPDASVKSPSLTQNGIVAAPGARRPGMGQRRSGHRPDKLCVVAVPRTARSGNRRARCGSSLGWSIRGSLTADVAA